MTTKEITGRHVLIWMVTAFGVIIAVNVTLAVKAVATFPGLEVKNSYVASQSFEARRTAQKALGWQVEARVAEDTLRIDLTDARGRSVRPARLGAVIGRPTIARNDQTLEFTSDGASWRAPVVLEPGLWVLKLTAESPDGTQFSKRIDLRVR